MTEIYIEHGLYNTGCRYAVQKIARKWNWGEFGWNLEIYSPEYLEQFINLRVPRKQWPLIHHLSKNTTY